MARKLILDVDTGTDDAVAIMLAALHEDLDLIGVTTVNGNAELSYCTDNSLRVLAYIGKPDIPVYAGCAKPLIRNDFPVPRTANDLAARIHGKHLPLPETSLKAQQQHAVEYLIETYRNATDPITLVPVAPLTNIAAALAVEPKLVDLIPEIIIMGGGHDVGNVTPAAEFNIWADPEAAYAVFNAGFENLTMVPLDATHKALISATQCRQFDELGTPAGKAMAAVTGHRIGVHDKIQRMEIEHSAPIHDALCIAHLIQRDVIMVEEHPVDIEIHGDLTVGRTIVDKNRRGSKPVNCKVAFDANAALFVDIMMQTFSNNK